MIAYSLSTCRGRVSRGNTMMRGAARVSAYEWQGGDLAYARFAYLKTSTKALH